LEATALGTRACVDALTNAAGGGGNLRVAGGATRSKLWLQMHADACGRAVVVGESAEAPLLGCAVLASALAGVHGSVAAATDAMVRPAFTVEPGPDAAALDEVYRRVYRHGAKTLAPLSHRTAARPRPAAPQKSTAGLVAASLLAADAAALGDAAEAALDGGSDWLHVDVFDGSAASNGALSSMGPQTVAALRARLPTAYLDVHVGCQNPDAVVDALLEHSSGITIQFESCVDAAATARRIRAAGVDVGVCIAPETPVAAVEDLLSAGLVDTVDVLAVAPGRGGQAFDAAAAVPKLKELRKRFPAVRRQVDGGIDEKTAKLAVAAGADVLVAGSFLFANGVEEGVDALRGAFEA